MEGGEHDSVLRAGGSRRISPASGGVGGGGEGERGLARGLGARGGESGGLSPSFCFSFGPKIFETLRRGRMDGKILGPNIWLSARTARNFGSISIPRAARPSIKKT